MKIRLACPACGASGGWTVSADGEIWRDPAGAGVAVVTGTCDRCGSRVLLDPSEEAVEHIRARMVMSRARAAEVRKAMARQADGDD